MRHEVTLIATSAFGLEALVAREIKALGYEPLVENGKVTFQAPLSAIPRCNIWLRTADRVKLVVGEIKVKTFDELFEAVKSMDWEEYIPEDGECPVVGKSHKSTLFSVPDCQAIVKKAIVDRMKLKHGIAGKLPESGALYRVEVALLKDVATLTIDTSGAGLHKRGYRTAQGEAPIRETLAAALIMLTNWRASDPFIDPFCGSGTIPIEAALIGQNIAPGFNREFVSELWPIIKNQYWVEALDEAEQLADYNQKLSIMGSDLDHNMIGIAKQNALEAGLSDLVNWKQMQVADLSFKQNNGYLVGNPPYGERIKDEDYVRHIYRQLGEKMSLHESWSVYIITSFKAFEKEYGKKATKKRKLFNGFIETEYYQYFGEKK